MTGTASQGRPFGPLGQGKLLAGLALAALVALAGCGGLTADRTPTPTATPAPVPTATPSATSPGTVVPGVARDGTVRVDRLLARHHAALANRSYTFEVRRVVRHENRTVQAVRSRLEAAPGARVYRFVQYANGTGPAPGAEPVVDLWHNDTLTLLRRADSRGRPYVQARNLDSEPVEDPTFRGFLRETLSGFRFRVIDRSETVRLVATGLVDRNTLTPPAPFERPTNASLSVTVGPSGVVRSSRLAYDATDGDRRIRVVQTTRVAAVGTTTVSVPEWAPIDRDPSTPGGRIAGGRASTGTGGSENDGSG